MELLRLYFSKFYRWVTEPYGAFPSDFERQNARQTASLFFVLMLSGWLGATLGLRLPMETHLAQPMTSALLVIMTVVYFLTRTRFYRLVIFSAALVVYAILLYLYVSSDSADAIQILTLFALIVLIISLVLPIWMTGLMTSLVLVTVLLLIISTTTTPIGSIIFYVTIMVTMLSFVAAFIGTNTTNRLRESESRYRTLMEATFYPVLIHSENARILETNKTFEEYFGYTRDEIVGKKPIVLVAPESRDLMIEKWEARAQDPYELTFLNKAGERLVMTIIVRPQIFRGQPAYVVIGRDMTTQQEAARQTLEYAVRYESLFTQTINAVFISNLERYFILANERASHLLKCEMPDIIGKNALDFVALADQEKSQQRYEAMLSGNNMQNFEINLRRYDGTEFPAEISTTLVRNANEEPLYFQSIVRDLTNQKRNQQQAVELALQNARIEMLEQFISDASHHFRTPLTNLKTSAYLLQRLRATPEKQTRHFDTIAREIARIENLLSNLLLVTRLEKETNHTNSNPAKLHINDLVGEMLHLLKTENNFPNITWDYQAGSGDLNIIGIRTRLVRALAEVADNAARYTPDEETVTLVTYAHEAYVVVEIQDVGIGMSAYERAHAFNYFYRADAANDMDSVRNGLGLSIARKIIQMHGGIIQIKSKLWEGTTVQIILPHAKHPIVLQEDDVQDIHQPAAHS